MKKILIIMVAAICSILTSCDDERVIFDPVNGQTGLSFGTTAYNVSVPEEGLTLEIPINVTTVSDTERTFGVTVDDGSIGGSSNYSLGTVSVPANSYNAVLEVNLNFDPLTDGDVYTLLLQLETPESGVVYDETVTIECFKEIVCNDFLITVVTDTYGAETTWEITNESGEVAATGGPYENVSGGGTYTSNIYLDDGCYTFTIYDSYGDGQQDGSITGFYTVECSILDVLTGGGAFSSSESKNFCVNP